MRGVVIFGGGEKSIEQNRGMGRLQEFGFLTDISFSDILDSSNSSIECDFPRLGISQTIQDTSWRFLTQSLTPDGKRIGWHLDRLYREGTYGKIYKAHRMVVTPRNESEYVITENPHQIIVKQTVPSDNVILSNEDVSAHTAEALLHILAWMEIRRELPTAIPQPFEVFGDFSEEHDGWLSLSLCMSQVKGWTIYSFFQTNWSKDTLLSNAVSFLEILAQVAIIISRLQLRLRMNHRDMKVNNIMIRRRREEPLRLCLSGLEIVSSYEITLIDFGFACIGSATDTTYQAGSWFPLSDGCFKRGRDLAQLIYCIHCYFPLNEFLPNDLFAEVRRWMTIPWSGGHADVLSEKSNFDTGIYELLRRPEVDPPDCAPDVLFAAIHAQGLKWTALNNGSK